MKKAKRSKLPATQPNIQLQILKSDLSPPLPKLYLQYHPLVLTRPLTSLTTLHRHTFSELTKLSAHPLEEKCTICMFEFSDADSDNIIRLDRCEGHYFHLECIEMCHSRAHLRCPICGIIYGILTGDMPEGSMNVIQYPPSVISIEDLPNVPVLEIAYHFKSGIRENVKFQGTSRVAFLPDNQEGREVLRLLLIAFERGLTFTIGTSVTTGRANQVIWNGIHHKTAVMGGPSCFGYPDPTYFSRVKEELAAKGIF